MSALTLAAGRLPGPLRARAARWLADLDAARRRRAEFNRCYEELSALDDRALADLGIARSEIGKTARRATLGR